MQYKQKLKKRAKRKYLNFPVVSALAKLKSPLVDKYVNSLSCSSLIINKDGKLQSRYCKRPWCGVCSPIRTAVRINNYKDALGKLQNLQLTTLTCPSVAAWGIKKAVNNFRKVFRQFRNTYKKRLEKEGYSEGLIKNFYSLRGVYNFEFTFNKTTKLFHPHIHILHNDIGISIVDYWLMKNPDCNRKAQDQRQCYDIIEAFKYQTKSVFSVRIDGKNRPYIPARELDAVYQAIQNMRCFQPFGIKKISDAVEEKQMDELEAYEVSKDVPEGSYLWDGSDWVQKQYIDYDTGEVYNQIFEGATVIEVRLSGFKVSDKLKTFYDILVGNQFYT